MFSTFVMNEFEPTPYRDCRLSITVVFSYNIHHISYHITSTFLVSTIEMKSICSSIMSQNEHRNSNGESEHI